VGIDADAPHVVIGDTLRRRLFDAIQKGIEPRRRLSADREWTTTTARTITIE
jgi:hypothetical protein